MLRAGNTGLGKDTILHLAQHNATTIFLAARTESKALAALEEIKAAVPKPVDIRWLPLDLTSTKSIKQAATTFQEQATRLDLLILNAGIMATPPGRTDLNHEIQLGTNHTGHFLLTKLLLPTLTRTAEESGSDVRIISVASEGQHMAPSFKTFMDQDALAGYHTTRRYGASKAANVLFAAELARRYPSITSVSIHPGVIITDLYVPVKQKYPILGLLLPLAEFFTTPLEKGAFNQLWAAAGAQKKDLKNGAYYVPVGNLRARNSYANNEEYGKTLWEWTEAELAKNGL